ncbi:MAG: DUF5110 domain-containing protein, partial [Planctomycetes bacterium]|nr:DUF5110 domain-containing protein [Planctomycetota bacterium]
TISNTSQAFGHDLEIRVYGKVPARYDMYEDDGKTFDYMQGQYARRIIEVYKAADGQLKHAEVRVPADGPVLFGKVAELKVMGQE